MEVWFEVERLVESEEIAAIFEREREMTRCQEGEVVGSWAPGFVIHLGLSYGCISFKKRKEKTKKGKKKI